MRTTADPEPLVYDVRNVARALKGPNREVLDLINKGHLPARRLPGGRVVILRDELLEFLRSLPRLEGAG